jgi:hypothetical protein
MSKVFKMPKQQRSLADLFYLVCHRVFWGLMVMCRLEFLSLAWALTDGRPS